MDNAELSPEPDFGYKLICSQTSKRCCTRIGDHVVDLVEASSLGLFDGSDIDVSVFSNPTLNAFASLGQDAVRKTRSSIKAAFDSESKSSSLQGCLVPSSDVEMHVPFAIGDYTDFLCSKRHALNMAKVMMGEEKLMPGFLRHPVAYHGRGSSVIASGAQVRRPLGTTFDPSNRSMRFGPSEQLDFEVEMVRLRHAV